MANAYEQSYESCSMTAWETFRSVNDFLLGVPLEKAKENAAIPENVTAAYKISTESGAKYAYIGAHIHYKKCASSLSKSASLSQIETMYKNCAYLSATRANILIYIDKGMSEKEIKAKLPARLHELVSALYSAAKNESFVKAANTSANALMRCVETVRGKENA